MVRNLFLFILILNLNLSSAFAQISELVEARTSNPLGASLRDGSIPPLPGVELYVFDPTGGAIPGSVEPPYETVYEIEFKVTEQPAIAVVIPGEVIETQYLPDESGDLDYPDKFIITFIHKQYAGGVEQDVFGPISDFSIAIIPASAEGFGPPAEMAGSWMATNISPANWQLIPPTAENPAFGYSLSGPEGAKAFFHIFIPNTLLDQMSLLYGEPITAEDLAVFNNKDQVSINSKAVTGGARIEIEVIFTKASNDVEDQEITEESRLARSGNVNKQLTVKPASEVSLNASKKTIKSGKRANVYGWVKNGTLGEKVKLISIQAKADAIKRGLTYRPMITKLNEQGKFNKRILLTKSENFRATFQRKGEKVKRSNVLKLKVR